MTVKMGIETIIYLLNNIMKYKNIKLIVLIVIVIMKKIVQKKIIQNSSIV